MITAERETIQKQRTAFERGAEFGWNYADRGYGASRTAIAARAEAATVYPVPTRPRVVKSLHNPEYSYRVFNTELQYGYHANSWVSMGAVWVRDLELVADLIKNPTEEAI
jgi:hypothetical protein